MYRRKWRRRRNRRGLTIEEKVPETVSGECPFCECDDIQGDSFDVEGNHVYQRMFCLGCEESWDDEYRLVRQANTDGRTITKEDK